MTELSAIHRHRHSVLYQMVMIPMITVCHPLRLIIIVIFGASLFSHERPKTKKATNNHIYKTN